MRFLSKQASVLLIAIQGIASLPAAAQSVFSQERSAQSSANSISANTSLSRALLEARSQQAEAAIPPTHVAQPPPSDFSDSPVYGANLFQGNFASESVAAFNPEHIISIGNVISIKVWGVFEYQDNLTVDEQGNIFLPKIGPIQVQGVANRELTKVVLSRVRMVYSGNIGVYCNLAVAQPVKVFVTGAVVAPGTYAGTSSDSVLRFLDRARGIDPMRGSFLQVDVMRRNKLLHRFNLYDFIRKGTSEGVQFLDGDSILVHPRQNIVKVAGVVQNTSEFEFTGASIKGEDILGLAVPKSDASHVKIKRRGAGKEVIEYLPISQARTVEIYPGDEIDVVSDQKTQSIGVRIEGEHVGNQIVVVPYGSRLKDVLPSIKWAPTSNREAIQIFRKSVKAAQKEMLLAAIDRLEKTILMSQSSSADEARLRAAEAEVFLKWIDKARKVEPKGQVVMTDISGDFLLEPGDVIRVPRISDVVMVQGEVNFPSSFSYSSKHSIKDYINMAGGYNEFGDNDNIVMLRPSGAFDRASMGWFGSSDVHPGDQILVLPEVKTKYLQIAKDVTQIIYQMAVSTGVVLRLL